MKQVASYLTRGTAVLLVLLGGAVCAAWLKGLATSATLFPASSPMVFNTAIAFIVAGLALLCLNAGIDAPAMILAALVLTLAALTLAEFLFGANYGIDEVFVRDLVHLHLASPGRMAPNTATAFLLSGTALFIMSLRRNISSSSIAAVLGALTFALGITALAGYLFSLEPAYEWGWTTRMSGPTSIAFALLGVSVMAAAMHRSGTASWDELPWLGTAVGAGFSLMSIVFWHVLRAILGKHADAPTALHLPNLMLLLGLCTSALLAATIAQAAYLHRQTAKLEAANRLVAATSREVHDLYDNAPCGYHSLDRNGVIVDINETELRWLGYRREQVVGRMKIVDLLSPASATMFRDRYPPFMKDGEIHDQELELIRHDGSMLPVLLSATAIFDADGSYVKSRSSLFDITDRKRIDQERQRAAEHLRKLGEEIQDLYDHAPCGYHSLDAEGRILRINDTELSWTGYSRTELIGRKFCVDLLKPDSRARFEQRQRDALHTQVADEDYDLVCKNGAILPVSMSTIAVFDSSNRLVETRATVHDITQRKQLELLLREGERRLHHLLDRLQTAVVVHGPDTTIRYVNPAATRLLGLTVEQAMGKAVMDPFWQFLRDDGSPMPAAEFPVAVVLNTGEALQDYIVGVRSGENAEPRWMLVNATPDYSERKALQQVIVSFIDISERRKLERELEYHTQTDLLTGLATRRHFLQLAEHEMNRHLRLGSPMSLLMADVDHFKSINDRFGHQAGDAVLAAVGHIMKQTLRRIDVAARFGGEEFVVVLPSTDIQHAIEAAERLRQAIADMEVPIEGHGTLKLTVSIGAAECSTYDQTLNALIKRADEAMYACKRSGRNCVSAATPPSAHQSFERPAARSAEPSTGTSLKESSM